VARATPATSTAPSQRNVPSMWPAGSCWPVARNVRQWWGGNGDPRSGQDHREHGDRPQCHARPVELDERSRDPFHDMGMGHECGRQNTGVPPTTSSTTKYTNILGMDDDVGYSILRVTVTSPGSRTTSATCCSTPSSRFGFEWGLACSPSNSARSQGRLGPRNHPPAGGASSPPRPKAAAQD